MGQEGRSVHYVNPVEFYHEMVEFHATHCHLPKGERPKKIPDSIGKKILLICQRLSYSRDFYHSPHREEMVGDAIETCIKYIRNWDPAVAKNPFAYFTQLAYFSFLQRAGKEKEEFLTKVRWVQQVAIHEVLEHANNAAASSSDDGHSVEFANHLSAYMSYSDKPQPKEEGQVARPKRTTLAYQKKMAEKKAAIEEKGIVVTDEIVDILDDFINVEE